MSPRRPRRLLTIGHAYSVALNRRLAHEIARVAGDEWEVTAVAPAFFHGDLRPIPVEAQPGERCRLATVRAYLTRHPAFFFYGARLRSILRGQPWDFVHCWEEPYVVAGGQIAWWCPAGTPLIFHTSQNIAKRYPPPFSAIERMCTKRCSGWTASGEGIARVQLDRGWNRRPCRVIPLGVDIELFKPDLGLRRATLERLEWDESGPPVVGYTGRFIEAKGLRLLMRVLEETPAPWRALWIGGGPMEAVLRAWAQRYGDRVRIVTGVAHDAVPAYLNVMDVLAAPSQTTAKWREQFGRMLIEAFACGVPVLASDSGEIPGVVGDAGVIAGEHDEERWHRELGDLLESPARRTELAARGVDRAHRLYAWPIVARRYLEFFDQLMAV